jgi:RNA polymerase sigma-70 factor (ECF subfamily)
MSEESYDHIVEKLAQEGESAVAELFSQFRVQLEQTLHFRMDPRLLGRVDAHDVLQEAYLNAAKRLPEYLNAPNVPPFIWIRSLTLNVLIDTHRRHLGAQRRDVRQQQSLQQGSPLTSQVVVRELIGQLTSPSQAAMRTEMAAMVEAAIDDMDEIDREVLVLRHFEQLTNQQVADVLGLKKAAASNRYVRALGRLREALSEFESDSNNE